MTKDEFWAATEEGDFRTVRWYNATLEVEGTTTGVIIGLLGREAEQAFAVRMKTTEFFIAYRYVESLV